MNESKIQYIIEQICYITKGFIAEHDKSLILQIAEKEGFNKDKTEQIINEIKKKYFSANIAPDIQITKNKCPKCGSNIPLIYQICEYCGHIFTETAEKHSSESIIELLENSLQQMEKFPKPSFFRNLFGHYYILFPILATFFLYLCIVSHAQNESIQVYLLYFFTILGVLSILIRIIIVFANKKKPGYDYFKAEYEKYYNMARMFFGINTKIDNLLDTYWRYVKKFELDKKSRQKNLIIGYTAFSFLLVGSAIFFYLVFNFKTNDANDYFTAKYGMFYEKDFIIQSKNFYGEFSEFANLQNSKNHIVYELQRKQYEHPDFPEVERVSLVLPKVAFEIKQEVTHFFLKDTFVVLKLKAVLKDSEGNKLIDTLTNDLNKNEFRVFNNIGSVFITDLTLKVDIKTFTPEVITELKTKAKYYDIFSEFQYWKGTIRLK